MPTPSTGFLLFSGWRPDPERKYQLKGDKSRCLLKWLRCASAGHRINVSDGTSICCCRCYWGTLAATRSSSNYCHSFTGILSAVRLHQCLADSTTPEAQPVLCLHVMLVHWQSWEERVSSLISQRSPHLSTYWQIQWQSDTSKNVTYSPPLLLEAFRAKKQYHTRVERFRVQYLILQSVDETAPICGHF